MSPKKKSHLKDVSNPPEPSICDLDFDSLFGSQSRKLTPAARAQELVYDAWDCSRKSDRVRLAKQAVSIDPDCVDALVILAADSVRTPSEEIALLERAVTAGARVLGKDVFIQDVGHFWGLIETRPYMRARGTLAQALWKAGRTAEAMAHFEELIRLNPNDNQGNRYILLSWCFQLGDLARAQTWIDAYPNDIVADWAYARFLVQYLSGRDDEGLKIAARKAIEANGWVPAYLRGELKVPKKLPDAMALRSKEEAIVYASNWLSVWTSHVNAIERLTELESELLGNVKLPARVEEALSTCAWCRISIQEDREVFGLGAGVRKDFDLGPWRGSVLTVAGPDGIDIPCVVADEESDASIEGQDLQFMVCSLGCADHLRNHLTKKVGFVTHVFPDL